jgi:hypothetical protein
MYTDPKGLGCAHQTVAMQRDPVEVEARLPMARLRNLKTWIDGMWCVGACPDPSGRTGRPQ